MGLGRKNQKRASHRDAEFSLQENQSIVQVVSLRGSNIIEVLDAEGVKSLALFPAKFQKSLWIKRGSFVVVDGSARKEVLDSGCKVTCMVSQVLFHHQVQVLLRSPDWPEAFRVDSSSSSRRVPSRVDSNVDEDVDFLPPLEENLNRSRPADLCSDSDSDSGTS